jgi:tyrosyl-tRNA synthetase
MITTMAHSALDLDNAIKASNILFGNSTADDLKQLDEATFLDVFDGVPQKITRMKAGIEIIGSKRKTGFKVKWRREEL